MAALARQNVFVYGTLKRGERNNHYIAAPLSGLSHLVGRAQTRDAWPLVVDTTYNLPLLVDARGTGKRVFGDVYSVDDVLLDFCDDFEGHPHMYERRHVTVDLLDTAASHAAQASNGLQVWAYLLTRYKPRHLLLPMYEDYAQAARVKPYQDSECLNEADVYHQLNITPPQSE